MLFTVYVNTIYRIRELGEDRENVKAFPVLINSIIKRFIGILFLVF